MTDTPIILHEQQFKQLIIILSKLRHESLSRVVFLVDKNGQQIAAQGEALQGVAGELRKQGKDGPAQVAEQAAEKVKQAGEYLEQADGEQLVQAAQDAARENPAAAAAVSAAAGFAAGRVIKASSPDDDAEDEQTTPDPAPADPGPGAP